MQSRLLVDRYELITPLGRGTMGTVWRAHDRSLGRVVAVKEIRHDPALGEEQRYELRERMIREGRSAARVTHPSVATIYDAIEVEGRPWIIMELVEGRSLEQVIEEEGPLPPRLVAGIGHDLLGALRAAHQQGILHRDVKPSNVLLTESGRVVLTDFGIAKALGDTALTRTGMVIGSPGYTAPERARGEHTGPESDLWSLGATLYYAVEGRPAYERNSISATLAALMTEEADPPTQAGPLRPVLDGLLQKDHTVRLDPTRAAAMLRAVADLPAGSALPAEFETPLAPPAGPLAGALAEPLAEPLGGPPAASPDEARDEPPTIPRPARSANTPKPAGTPTGTPAGTPTGTPIGTSAASTPSGPPPPIAGPTPGPTATRYETSPQYQPAPPYSEDDPDRTMTVARPLPGLRPSASASAPPAAATPPPVSAAPASAAASASAVDGAHADSAYDGPSPHGGGAGAGRSDANDDTTVGGLLPHSGTAASTQPPPTHSGPMHMGAIHSDPTRSGPMHLDPSHSAPMDAGLTHAAHAHSPYGQSASAPVAAHPPHSGTPRQGTPHQNPPQAPPSPSDGALMGDPGPATVRLREGLGGRKGLGTELFGMQEPGKADAGGRVRVLILIGVAFIAFVALVFIVMAALGAGKSKTGALGSTITTSAGILTISASPSRRLAAVGPVRSDTRLSTPSATPSPAASAAAFSGPSADQAKAPVAGLRRHDDPAGFRIDVPVPMKVEGKKDSVLFREPDDVRSVRVDLAAHTSGDLVQGIKKAEEQSTYDDYRLIGVRTVEPTPYPGTDVADWEFTYTAADGTPLHAVSRWVYVPSGASYAIYWVVPQTLWNADAPLRDAVLASFSPARPKLPTGS